MSETTKRILSGIVLSFICLAAILGGIIPLTILLFLLGLLLVDELLCNFFKTIRKSWNYICSQFVFAGIFLLSLIFHTVTFVPNLVLVTAFVLNVFFLFYLFVVQMNSKKVVDLLKVCPCISSMIVVMPVCSMLTLFAFDEWRFYSGILILTAFGMDTGAWFFGKKFGRNLLWPKVSPKKTIEGLIGGLFTSVILSSLFVIVVRGKPEISWCVGFALVALLSHVGDLAQSKLKRQFRIKDSSSLIPGHGGVYDRIDGLIFSAPFFIAGLVLWGIH